MADGNNVNKMDLLEKSDLTLDETGTLRSNPLPRIQGTKLQLPEQLDTQTNLDLWQSKLNDPSELIVLDLFSGAGGFSYGFKSAGFLIAAGVDRDESSIWTHGYNFLSKSVCTDITDIDDPKEFLKSLGIPRIDIVIGGPPCQGFSQVGKAAIKKLGIEDYYHDVLNNLYREFVRFVDILRPKAFVMENVPAMASFQDGELVKRIIDRFKEIGYSNTEPTILNAKYHGVPQSRRRLFIGGVSDSENDAQLKFPWPNEDEKNQKFVTLEHAISDLPACKPPIREDEMPYNNTPKSKYQKLMRKQVKENIVYDHIIRDVREDDKLIFSLMEEGHKYTDIPEELRRYRSDSFKDKYSKMIWDEPSWTVTAHIRKDTYRYIHPDKEQGRMLSIREFARLQSFPDHFRFCGAPTRRMQQIGNAVPPLLAQTIAEQLYKLLRSPRSNIGNL